MKPMGPLPPEYVHQAGALTIAGLGADALVEQAGSTPLFVYDIDAVALRVARFRAAFPRAARPSSPWSRHRTST